ncbi:MAG: sigma-E factor negative regulatory protein [Gammaproteobacteria bacterium]
MSDLLHEQVSAFMDGELPDEECALLLKRVAANAELTECWHAYHLIGDALKDELAPRGAQSLAGRVERALHGPSVAHVQHASRPRRRAVRRSATVAAGVAAIGLAGLLGALVMRQMSGGGQVLVPGTAASHSAAGGNTIRHVDWRQTPRPVRAELNRYLLMHEVYGAGPMAVSGNAALGPAASRTAVSAHAGG